MNNKNLLGIGAVVLVLALIGLGAFLSKDKTESTAAAPEMSKPEAVIRNLPEPTPAYVPEQDWPKPEPMAELNQPEIKIVTPPTALENSDPQFLLAAADLAPELSQWLLPDEQIRKWVLALDLMAEGKLPKRYRPVDYPMDKFAVEPMGLDTVAAEDNQQRMTSLIDTITAIKPAQAASYYRAWLPIIEKAYDEQGKNNSVDQRLRQAISQVLAVDSLEQPAALIRPSVLYKFEDPVLEDASDIEKLLWRMGPENAEKLQNFLRDLRAELYQ
ncbi:DUF3014 domain-containing protein [Oceanicoccus sp. KOV_DT_Chl]|uniref:DUF3014 domain-containing protein n=1 Tax=Oceanicoccus sp. KOV_DT_Chl TaxID=1904639 RepID=UPI000C7D447D|nr:DUF3014 domain-containing protein [Oceanicoccus sp. KOV_DT_Chl]